MPKLDVGKLLEYLTSILGYQLKEGIRYRDKTEAIMID